MHNWAEEKPSSSCRITTEADVDDSEHSSCSRMLHRKYPKTRRRNQKQHQRKTKKNAGRGTGHKETPGVPSSGRGEKRHRNTREYVCEETSDDGITEAAG